MTITCPERSALSINRMLAFNQSLVQFPATWYDAYGCQQNGKEEDLHCHRPLYGYKEVLSEEAEKGYHLEVKTSGTE